MKYHFKIYKDRSGGFWAECIELKGCRTEGETRSEVEKNLSEVLNLYLSEPPDSKYVFPRPKKYNLDKNLVAVSVKPSVAIANRIRELRLKNDLTQVDMKLRLGIKNLSNYQRLEDPERANPQWKTLFLIKKIFPNFQLDDLMI